MIRECLKWDDTVIDTVILRSTIQESVVTIMKTNCAQVRQSIRPNRIVSCLGANMKKYVACENRMDHSLHPTLCEYLFKVANSLLTVTRAVGTLAGNPTLEITEGVNGSTSTHGKSFDNNDIDKWEDCQEL